jgi:uncharacterized protein YgiB involved in biofilm formation
MKRSDKISLTLMGAAAVGWTLDLGFSDGGPVAFSDISQCVNAGYGQATCRQAFDDALRLHLAGSPKFSSSASCQAATDTTCVAVQPRGGGPASALLYAPAFSAFKVRENNCRKDGERDCGGSGSGGSGGGGRAFGRAAARQGDPLYEARSKPGSYREMGAFSEAAKGRAGPPTLRSATVSRGGFGSFGGLRVGD